MHNAHRSARVPTGRQHRRGFSITELSVALAFFAIFAAGITSLLGAAVTNRATLVQETDVVAAVADLADRMATQPYAVLLADEFTVPEPCNPAQDTGSTATSCVSIRQGTYPITWTITPIPATDIAVAQARITATFTVDRGVQRTLERTVVAPLDGYTPGEAVIRVNALQDTATLTGRTVYLLDASETVVATGAFSASGISLLTADATACTTPAPCAVSLSATGWGMPAADDVVLTGPAARGNLVTVTDALTTAVVGVGEAAQMRVLLMARNDSGQVALADDTGSICLWASITDDGGRTSFPVCNTEDPGALTVTDYPTGRNATARMALTEGASVRWSVDSPDGTCPRLPEQDTPGVCTSYTWGTPNQQWTPAGTEAFGTAITLDAMRYLAVIWQGAQARPASGYAGEPVWSFPRAVSELTPADCDTAGTCEPVTVAPEAADCPDEHCLSTATPAAAVTWDDDLALTVPTASAVTSTLVVSGDDTPTLTLLQAPTSGTLAVIEDGTPRTLAATDTISTTGNPTVRYTPATSSVPDTFVVRVTTTAGTRDVRLYTTPDTSTPVTSFTATGSPWWTAAASRTIGVLTLDMTGVPASGDITATYGTDISGTASMTTSIRGWGALAMTPTGIGTRSFTTSVSPLDIPATWTLTSSSTASVIEISAPTSATLGAIPVTLTARDSNNDPLEGALVRVAVTRGGSDPQASWSPEAWCLTSAAGSCTLTLTPAATGTLTVRGIAGQLVDVTTVTVTS